MMRLDVQEGRYKTKKSILQVGLPICQQKLIQLPLFVSSMNSSTKSMFMKTVRKMEKNERKKLNNKNREKKKKKLSKTFLNHSPYDNDIYGRTGLTKDMFRELYEKIRPNLVELYPKKKKKKKKICDEMSLFNALTWLRLYTPLLHFADEFKISEATISRTIDSVLPVLAANLHFIHMSEEVFEIGAIDFTDKNGKDVKIEGQIDCTDHPRYRVHPGSLDLFRFDKQEYFLLAQVTINNVGNIANVKVVKGHNNDKGCFNRSNLKTYLRANDIYLLADNGYSDIQLVCPSSQQTESWNDSQKQMRQLVEQVNSFVGNWKASSSQFSGTIEKQALALRVIYKLAAWRLQKKPLREPVVPAISYDIECTF